MLTLPAKRLIRRSGSILILVVAVLAILALTGTVFITNARLDRPASQQNSINTEADLLMQGLVCLTRGVIPDGRYGNGSAGKQLRAPSQEMPSPLKNATSGYSAAVSPGSEMMLADRVPDESADNAQVSWDTFLAHGN